MLYCSADTSWDIHIEFAAAAAGKKAARGKEKSNAKYNNAR